MLSHIHVCLFFSLYIHRFDFSHHISEQNRFLFHRAVQSQCLGGLLTYFSTQSDSSHQQEWAIWYAVGLTSCAFVSTAFTNPFQLYAYQMGMQIRVICTSLVYRKVIQAYNTVR